MIFIFVSMFPVFKCYYFSILFIGKYIRIKGEKRIYTFII